MADNFTVVTRIDKAEVWATNVSLPIEGDPVIYAQGKNLSTYAAEVFSDKSIKAGSMVFGPLFSGEVQTSVKENKFSGTPYIVTQVSAVGK